MTKTKIDWAASVGTANSEAFAEGIPAFAEKHGEDLTLKSFDVMDRYRDAYAADVAKQVMTYGDKYFDENPDTEVVTLAETGMGGNTSVAVAYGADRHLTVSTATVEGELMQEVIKQSEAAYAAELANVTELAA